MVVHVHEKKGPLPAAIPYMPFPVAVTCLFLNAAAQSPEGRQRRGRGEPLGRCLRGLVLRPGPPAGGGVAGPLARLPVPAL